MLMAKRPAVTAANITSGATALRHCPRQTHQRIMGPMSSASVTFENVAIPMSAAATRSLVDVRSHAVARRGGPAATSLYSQQKYASRPTTQLNSSGIIQTTYTG